MSRVSAGSIRPDSASVTFWDRYFGVSASSESTSSPGVPRLPYIPALDGIRAISVVAVLLYHANAHWMTGGFLGVEVFFVLSGYLITSLLLAERTACDRVDLKSFWLRRARRLLPALFLLLVGTLAYSVVMLPNEVTQLRADATASAFYVMNWWLIFDHKSYFEVMGRPSLLGHVWSLAVEEQFYLIWPPLFALGMSRLRTRKLLLAVIAGGAASTALMAALYRSGVDPSRIYYGTDTRAAEMLVGAALALVWRPGEAHAWPGAIGNRVGTWVGTGRRAAILLEGMGIAALAGIGAAFSLFGDYSPLLYRGGFLLVALATATLIAVVVHPGSQQLSRLLGFPALRWIGLRSYGIYLWHWPVYMVTRPGLDVPLDGVSLLLLRIALTLVLVEISYRAVEVPFRRGAVGRLWRSWRAARWAQPSMVRAGWLGVSGAVAISMVILGIAVARATPEQPPPNLAVQEVHLVASPSAAAFPSPTPTPPSATPAPVLGTAATPTATYTGATATDVRSIAAINMAADTPTPTEAATPDSTPAPATDPIPNLTQPSVSSASYASAPAVTAVGDSVMLGAASDLAAVVPNLDLDAKVGLQISEAIQILHARRDTGRLHQVVVLDIGNNGPITATEFDQVMQVIGSERRVIFLNLRVPRVWEGPNNDVLAAGVARYHNALLLDWHRATVDHPELFWDDGIHLRPVGSRYYAMLVEHLVASVS